MCHCRFLHLLVMNESSNSPKCHAFFWCHFLIMGYTKWQIFSKKGTETDRSIGPCLDIFFLFLPLRKRVENWKNVHEFGMAWWWSNSIQLANGVFWGVGLGHVSSESQSGGGAGKEGKRERGGQGEPNHEVVKKSGHALWPLAIHGGCCGWTPRINLSNWWWWWSNKDNPTVTLREENYNQNQKFLFLWAGGWLACLALPGLIFGNQRRES